MENGIGLVHAIKIMRLQSGKVEVKSVLYSGSTFLLFPSRYLRGFYNSYTILLQFYINQLGIHYKPLTSSVYSLL